MLRPSTLADLARAVKEGKSSTTYGGKIVSDTTFSSSDSLLEVLSSSKENVSTSFSSEDVIRTSLPPVAQLNPTPVTVCSFPMESISDNIVYDRSRNGNLLSCTNCTIGEGKFGGGLEFNGIDSVAQAALSSTERLDRYLFISFWVSSASGTSPIFSIGDLECSIDNNIVKFEHDSNVFQASTDIGSGFNHVSFQYNAGNIILSVNGISALYEEEIQLSDLSLVIGEISGEYFEGVIDDFFFAASVRVEDDSFNFFQDSYHNITSWGFYNDYGDEIYGDTFLSHKLDIVDAFFDDDCYIFNGISSFGYASMPEDEFSSISMFVKVQDGIALLYQENGFEVYIDNNEFFANFYGTSEDGEKLSDLTLDPETWYYISIGHDGEKKSLWINGHKIAEKDSIGVPMFSPEPLLVGVRGPEYGEFSVKHIGFYRNNIVPYRKNIKHFRIGADGFEEYEDWMLP